MANRAKSLINNRLSSVNFSIVSANTNENTKNIKEHTNE